MSLEYLHFSVLQIHMSECSQEKWLLYRTKGWRSVSRHKVVARTTTKDVYFVIDGLDEGDQAASDRTPQGLEKGILIECLATLETHALYISRSSYNVRAIIPHAITKTILPFNNRNDIQSYI